MPRPFSPSRGDQERAADETRAQELQRHFADEISAVAVTFVDHSGAARVKATPLARLDQAARTGLGFSPVLDAFDSLGGINPASPLDKPDGDLRLVPDLDSFAALSTPAGWAWAPGDRFWQDGRVYPGDQRSFARAQVAAGLRQGITARMAFEVEWMAGLDQDDFQAAVRGTGYGLARLLDGAGYARDVLDSLEAAGVQVLQLHPEYGPGQFEVSVAAQDPVSAADTNVLVKLIISAVTAEHGWRAAFAPAVLTGNVGNGGHLHASFWSDGENLLAGGPGRHGLTERGESIAAALLDSLPALLAIGAPSPGSYLRLQPSVWAGAFQVWGTENREAALRLIEAGPGDPGTANLELKSFDNSANPYLVVGAVLAVALAGADRKATLPAEVSGDPASPGAAQARRLPGSLAETVAALAASADLRAALGDELLDGFLAARRAEIELAAGKSGEDIIAQSRWVL
ncbi:MAG TPA: glutamine synthetase family protein [Streptosporangiaceae bacterium]|nr:glutamine synthetase family protein [Streptosporangiaceae bacterium]